MTNCHTTKEMEQKIRGITLISLIITVVVIFILAGTSIGILTSDNGIFKNGNEAKEQTEISEEKNILKASAVSALSASSSEGILKDRKTTAYNGGEFYREYAILQSPGNIQPLRRL